MLGIRARRRALATTETLLTECGRQRSCDDDAASRPYAASSGRRAPREACSVGADTAFDGRQHLRRWGWRQGLATTTVCTALPAASRIEIDWTEAPLYLKKLLATGRPLVVPSWPVTATVSSFGTSP